MELDRQLAFFQPFFFTDTLKVTYCATVIVFLVMCKSVVALKFLCSASNSSFVSSSVCWCVVGDDVTVECACINGVYSHSLFLFTQHHFRFASCDMDYRTRNARYDK